MFVFSCQVELGPRLRYCIEITHLYESPIGELIVGRYESIELGPGLRHCMEITHLYDSPM